MLNAPGHPPRHEPFLVGRDGADARYRPVRNHAAHVRLEQLLNLGRVVLNLLEGDGHVRVFVRRVLQFDDAQGDAVDEDHQVRTAGHLPLDRELAHEQPVVVVRVLEVEHLHRAPPSMPVLFHLNGDAVSQPGVDVAIGLDEGLTRVLEQTLAGVLQGLAGQLRVQARECVMQPAAKGDLRVVLALRMRATGRDGLAGHIVPAQFSEPADAGFFEIFFGHWPPPVAAPRGRTGLELQYCPRLARGCLTRQIPNVLQCRSLLPDHLSPVRFTPCAPARAQRDLRRPPETVQDTRAAGK